MADKLVREGICTSQRVAQVSEGAEVLFYRLLVRSCGLGRYHADPAIIKATAFTNRPRVRQTDVASRLEELEKAGLIVRYTAPTDNTPLLWIPRLGQRHKYAQRSPFPAPPSGPIDAPGQEMIAFGPEPPPRTAGKKTRYDMKRGEERAREARQTFPAPLRTKSETDEAWLARLAVKYPDVDVAGELRAAAKKRQAMGTKVTREWFEEHWLPHCGTPVEIAGPPPKPDPIAEVEGWREVLATLYPPEHHKATRRILESGAWIDVPQSVRHDIVRALSVTSDGGMV